jgi:UDP-N-acetyl-D-mannosaminuronic acid transferase (WecB/TagA/CpsF family)
MAKYSGEMLNVLDLELGVKPRKPTWLHTLRIEALYQLCTVVFLTEP